MVLEEIKLSKEALAEKFSKDYKRYYHVELFDKKGFTRHKCRICGSYFWSIEDRDVCEKPEHTKYGFFRDKPRSISYTDFWKRFADFFKSNGHSVINRYPVVSRWRPDLYFTIADVQDFQRLENGHISFEYPANPLVVPQICLRFTDIENVGVTGRHFTGFMMAGQKAFNYPKEGYWRDRTIELNFEFLTKVLGIDENDIVYSEDAWAMGDFSEFGPCLESYSKGLELVNNVFTEFEYSNGKISELEGKVVDVGWGFERLLWYYTGLDNAYEATFANVLRKIRGGSSVDFDTALFRRFAAVSGEFDVTEMKNPSEIENKILKNSGITKSEYENKIKPMQATYAILDHIRTLLFAITDSALPSNMGGGYNLRVILRRALSFAEKYKLKLDFNEIAELIASDMKPLYPELSESLDTFDKVIAIEKDRYSKSIANATQIAERIISSSKSVSAKELKTLYESNGVTPEMLSEIAAKKGATINIPEGAYKDILEGDFAKPEKRERIEIELPKLPKTEKLYYSFATKAKAKVLFVKGKYIVLDKTPFYPEGGGQAADTGFIDDIKIDDVQKINDVIVHVANEDVENKLRAGALVSASVNEERRNRLIAHHTATHLISAAARAVLGKHAWQEGARKDPEKAHIDIAHYDKLTEKEIESIETMVNNQLRDGITVEATEMERGEAESKYGFAIYQGHGVPSKIMRIITIRSKDGSLIDAEACGGLHAVGRENLIRIVKIIDSYRIHDGVDRIVFVAGDAALDYFRKEHKELGRIAESLNSELGNAYDALERLQKYALELRKNNESYKEIIGNEFGALLAEKSISGVEKEFKRMPVDMMRKIASGYISLNPKGYILLSNSDGGVVCMSGKDSETNALELLRKKFGSKFRGGGSKSLAEGRIER
ncbi:MAG: alanine--tRNA ligase [Candidatus Micrarchaeaceae archaeon]